MNNAAMQALGSYRWVARHGGTVMHSVAGVLASICGPTFPTLTHPVNGEMLSRMQMASEHTGLIYAGSYTSVFADIFRAAVGVYPRTARAACETVSLAATSPSTRNSWRSSWDAIRNTRL